MNQVPGLLIAVATVSIIFLLSIDMLGGDGASVPVDGYQVSARFENVGNLQVGAAVTAAGVAVGQVTDVRYDAETYEAVVKMKIAHEYDSFSRDTAASVLTTGFVGEKYIELQPGAEVENLREGDIIDITSSAMILEQIIGQFIYSMSDEKPQTKSDASF